MRQVRFPIMPARTHISCYLGGKATARVAGQPSRPLSARRRRVHEPHTDRRLCVSEPGVNLTQDSTSEPARAGRRLEGPVDAYAGRALLQAPPAGQFLADRHEEPNGGSCSTGGF